jgi:hypothetical protein
MTIPNKKQQILNKIIQNMFGGYKFFSYLCIVGWEQRRVAYGERLDSNTSILYYNTEIKKGQQAPFISHVRNKLQLLD